MYTYPVLMKNLTLSVEERTLEAAREYAARHGTTVNHLVRDFLARTVRPESSGDWAEKLFSEMDRRPGKSGRPRRWSREDIYRERIDRLGRGK